MTASRPTWFAGNGGGKGRFWILVAVTLFIIAAIRFSSVGDPLGASVFGVVALVFAVRLVIELRRRKQNRS